MQGFPRCATHPDAEAEASCTRCGDFVCRVCTPLEPVALCARCTVRVTVDWEERFELGGLRAFLSTCRAGLGAPVRLGRQLGGARHALHALEYAALCSAAGLLPLALLLAVPLLHWADPIRLGLRSMGLLGTAVTLIPGALVLSTLWPLVLLVLATCTWLWARAFGLQVRWDVVLRAACYGASLLSLPVLGPVLLPAAVTCAGGAMYGAMSAKGDGARAAAALGGLLISLALLVCGASFLVR